MRLILTLALCAVVAACGGRADRPHDGHEHEHEAGHVHTHAEGEHHDHAGHDEHEHADEHAPVSEEIILPAAQAARLGLGYDTVRPAPFREVIESTGRILAAQGDEATVVAPVAGIVTPARPGLSAGASVRRGERLFTLTSRSLATGDEFARIEADYRAARSEWERLASLVDEGIVSRSEYNAAEAAYRKAETAYEAVARAQSGGGTMVTAPIGGYLTALRVREGEYVAVGQPLATVAQNRRLQLQADVPQRYRTALTEVRSANFRDPASDRCFTLDALGGRLLSVGRAADAQSTLVPVVFEFDNREGIIQGAFVEVYLLGAFIDGVLSVPLEAVTEAQGTHYVYVRLDDEGYMRRPVRLGGNDGQRVRILEGLDPGDVVVTRGAVHVKMASASGAIPHSHQH